MNTIAPSSSQSHPHQTLPAAPPTPNLSAFDLNPDAAIGLDVIWNSPYSDWPTKTENLHGALLFLPISSPLRDDLHFLRELAWVRACMEQQP
jgi:hypothetical protein